MLANIRKHQGWLWFIIAGTVIAFVIWGIRTPNVGGSSMTGSGNFGSVMGKPVSQEQYVNALNEARLRYFFSNGEWPDKSSKHGAFDDQRETYLRLLLVREIQDLGIHVSSQSVADAATFRVSQLMQGQSVPLDVFVNRVLAPAGLSAEDLARYISHDIGIEELVALVGAGGRMVTPEEIHGLYQREHEEVSVQAAFFQASNYLSKVVVSTPAFMQFYTNQMSEYHLPERVQVSYVAFASSNFMTEATKDMAQITNLDDVIEANYERMGTNFDAEAKTVDEKKAKIRQMMLEQRALVEANKKAAEFTQNLDAMDSKQGNLALLARTNGLAVQLSEPFDRDTPPEKLGVGADFSQHAFDLGPDGWFFGPLKGVDAVYVIELAKRLPDENPPFEEVRERVVADYKFNQALMLARLAGSQFYQTLTNSAGRGKSFSAMCEEAGVHPEYLPPLSISTPKMPEVEGRVNLNRFKQAVFGTPVGQISPFDPDPDGGYLVYVRSKLPIAESQMETDLPKFTAMVQQNRAYEEFNEWFSKEAQRGLRDTPLMQRQQQQQQPASSSGSAPQN